MSNHTFTILLIEDNAADARLVQEALAENKLLLDVQIAPDGEQAMARLLRQGEYRDTPRPDLILLDLNLPGMDGKEVLHQIKHHPDLKRIPVVILSTSNADRDIVQTYNLSANAYVVKPLDFEQFMHIVRSTTQFWLTVAVIPNGRRVDD